MDRLRRRGLGAVAGDGRDPDRFGLPRAGAHGDDRACFQRAQIFAALALGSPSFRSDDIVYDAYRTDVGLKPESGVVLLRGDGVSGSR